jgi:hypothetical protein
MSPRVTTCKHGLPEWMCDDCREENDLTKRKNHFIRKRDLSDLAQALTEFEKLSPEDKQWVINEIERIDRGEG